jgi:thiamine-phosphate pyrophosphorylase
LDQLRLCLVTDRSQTRGRELGGVVDECLAAGLPALQVREKDLAAADLAALCRRLRGPTRARGALLIGASVHSVDEAVDAEARGADWVVFGPVYDTPSKRPYGAPQGLDALAKVSGRVRLPVIAIGGITPARVAEVRAAGAYGVAAIAAILNAPSPADAVRRFLEALAVA